MGIMGGELFALLATLLPSASVAPCLVLDGLDLQRQVAFARAEPGLLDHVYAPGSAAGDADRALLADYRERGIRVEGARMIRRSCRAMDANRVHSVEKLGPAVALLPDGSRRALPQDRWDARVITLTFIEGRWRIAEVQQAAS